MSQTIIHMDSTLERILHRRYNSLIGEWILVSPHRTKRPWQGKQEFPNSSPKVHIDKDCYLCPGNTRSSSETNPKYDTAFVFNNDFSAFLDDPQPITKDSIQFHV